MVCAPRRRDVARLLKGYIAGGCGDARQPSRDGRTTRGDECKISAIRRCGEPERKQYLGTRQRGGCLVEELKLIVAGEIGFNAMKRARCISTTKVCDPNTKQIAVRRKHGQDAQRIGKPIEGDYSGIEGCPRGRVPRIAVSTRQLALEVRDV